MYIFHNLKTFLRKIFLLQRHESEERLEFKRKYEYFSAQEQLGVSLFQIIYRFVEMHLGVTARKINNI